MQRIILTTDLSPESERAFPVATEFARRFGVPLVLLHAVHDPGLAPALMTDVPGDVKKAKARLAELRLRLPADLEVTSVVHQVENVPDGIVEYAAEHDGMLVTSTHGRSGFRRLVIGSITEELLRRSTVPVVCVPMRGSA